MQTEMVPFDVAGLSLAVCMPTTRDLDPRVVSSLLETVRELDRRGIPCEFQMVAWCSIIERARDGLVWSFLASKSNRMLWLDSDITYKPADVIRLLCLSTKFDVVGACYPEKKDDTTFAVASRSGKATIEELGCFRLDGMGMGFTMIARPVMEKLAAEAPKILYRGHKKPLPNVFGCRTTEDGCFQGEDIAFFEDVREAGFEVWVDPSIELGHIGTKEYRASLASQLRAGELAIKTE